MPRKFCLAMALWVAPDFAEVNADRQKLPYVNHSKVDFEAVAALVAKTFPYGPPVNIRTTNDTIDQVTIQARVDRPGPPTMRGEDFGAEMLRCAKTQKGTVIDVRRAWRPLHLLPDRNHAPPPAILPFLIEAQDFEDAMLWCANAMPVLGLSFFPPQLRAISGCQSDKQHEGKIGVDVRRALDALFGCPYQEFAFLDLMSMDSDETAEQE